MKHPKYKTTKDGMFLIRLKDGKKIPIPSPIKLRNYHGLRTQLDVGTRGEIVAITRSVIDESGFSLGEPAIENGKPEKKKATPAAAARAKETVPSNGNGLLRGAYQFYQEKLRSLDEEALLTKQMLNRIAFDMHEPLPFPEP